jgi:hypothetical protein
MENNKIVQKINAKAEKTIGSMRLKISFHIGKLSFS